MARPGRGPVRGDSPGHGHQRRLWFYTEPALVVSSVAGAVPPGAQSGGPGFSLNRGMVVGLSNRGMRFHA